MTAHAHHAMYLLPWPPSVNTYWRHISRGKLAGRTLISENGRAYRKAVLSLFSSTRVTTMKGRLAMEIRAFPPDRRRRDIDNIAKAILDSLAHACVYVDDCQIDDLRIKRMAVDGQGLGRVEVVLMEIERGADA